MTKGFQQIAPWAGRPELFRLKANGILELEGGTGIPGTLDVGGAFECPELPFPDVSQDIGYPESEPFFVLSSPGLGDLHVEAVEGHIVSVR